MQEEVVINQSVEEEQPESVKAPNPKWEKTHPLTAGQNRALQIAFAVILLVVAVMLFFGFREMFEAQGQ